MTDDEEPVSVYDEVEIEDMTYDDAMRMFYAPCPCGDRFEIALVDLQDGQDIAVCPSCSLMIRVIFEVDNLPTPEDDDLSNEATEQTPIQVPVAA